MSGPLDIRDTDAMLAESFAEDALAGRFAWCHGLGWLGFDGVAWREVPETRVVEAAREYMLGKFSAAVRAGVDPKDWRGTLSRGRLRAIVDLGRGIACVDHERLDAQAHVLNTPKGQIDLRLGQVSPSAADAWHTKVTGGSWTADRSPLWESFLERVLPDHEVRAYLQRVIGHSLVGEVREHVMPILVGVGANGKGTLRDAVMHALGTYALEVDPALLVEGKHARHLTFVMELRGRRLVFTSETDKRASFAESVMKRLTGGDPLQANRMHQDPITFIPSHSLIMVTNNLPDVSEDAAVWRRLSVIDFDVVIPERERDGGLPEKLRAEASAVLSWCVEGLRQYLATGLTPPPQVQAATRQYRRDNDSTARFLDEVCRIDPHVSEGAQALYQAFAYWSRSVGAKPVTQREFPRVMQGHGIGHTRGNAGVRYLGVELPATTTRDHLASP